MIDRFSSGRLRRSGGPAAVWLLLASVLWPAGPAVAQGRGKRKEAEHYKQWLEQDVVYLISAAEKEVFRRLATDEEKDHFIEQFWERRDPDPATPENEFKIEHYRRLRYVNERYGSGKPGWRTDRGRFYIKFGPPDQTDAHPGGSYARKSYEGGGVTSVYPFERWWYRYLEGVGSDVEVEFVDATMTGDYKLALDGDEKDALFYTPVGPTAQELEGLMTRGDRVTRRYMGNPVNRDLQTQDGWFKYRRLQDQIWYRVAQMMQLDRPPALRNPQLRELVDARVSYATSLPVEPQAAWFRLDESEYFVAISISVPCRALTYRADNGIQTATVDLYGRVTGIDGRIYREFDDQLHVRYPPEQLSRHAYEQSIYQKALRLPAGRFRIDLLVKDQGTHVGLATLAVSIPRPAAGPGLELSPVVVAKHLRRLVGVPADVTPFVIGNVKVVPAFDRTFGPDDAVGVYLQAYGFQVDPTTQSAAVKVRYEISNRQGKTLRLYDDDGGRSHWLQGLGRLVVARELPLMGLPAGDYLLTIHVGDAIGGTEKSTSAAFKVA